MKKSTYRVNAWARAMVLTALPAFSIPAAAEVHTFVFTMDGAQEVPPNGSAGIGQCSVAVDDVARTVEVDCTYSGLTAESTAAHIHQGAQGVSGPPFVTLNHSAATSGSVTGFAPLTLQQLQDILAGHTYINVHSTAFPDGEVRGQIMNPPPPPVAIRVCGLLHEALGEAQLSGEDLDGDGMPDVLSISNIGSSGNDGARITLRNPLGPPAASGLAPNGWSGAIDFGPAGNLPRGLQLTVTARDVQNNTIPFFAVNETNNGDAALTLAPSCLGCAVRVLAIQNGNVVADRDYDGSADVVATGPIGLDSDTGGADGFRMIRLSNPPPPALPDIAIEKSFVFSKPTSIQLTGDAAPLADVDALHVIIIVQSRDFDPKFELLDATGRNTGGNDITIQQESLIAGGSATLDDAPWSLRALGLAHMVGTEVCEGSPKPTCIGAIELANLGQSGQDGVEIGLSDVSLDDADGQHTHSGCSVHFDPLLLDLEGDGVSIGSMWTSNKDGDAADFLTSWCRVLGTGGAIEVTADFSDLAAPLMSVEVFNNGASVGRYSLPPGSSIIMDCCVEPCAPAINSLTDASHAYGENVPAYIIGLTEPVCVFVGGEILEGDELRLAADVTFTAGDLVILRNGLQTTITGESRGTGTIHITGIEPAAVSFTEGYVFGLQHTGTDGATLSLGCGTDCTLPPGTGSNLPLTVSGRGGGGVIIHTGAADFLAVELGDERELTTGLDWSLRGTAYGQDPTGLITLLEFQLNVEEPGKGDPDPPVIIGVDFAPSGASLQTITVHHEGGTVTELRNMPNQTPITSEGATTDKAMPKLTQASTKGQGPEPGPEVGFGWDEPVAILVGGSFITDAGRFVLTSAQSPTINPPLSQVDLEMLGGLREFTIADEALGVFDLDHRADGARFGCCADADGDGQLDLVMFNPLATGGAAAVSTKPKQIAVATILSAAHTCEFIVPDPCAGKPEPCEVYPDGATLMSQATFQTTTGGSSQNSSCWIHLAQPAASDCPKGQLGPMCDVTLTIDFTELGVDTVTVEVLNGEIVVATIPNFAGPVFVSCDTCAPGARFSEWVEWTEDEPSPQLIDVSCTTSWDGLQHFSFEKPRGDGRIHEGDALRFTATSAVGDIEGITSHELSTVNITEVLITDMQFELTPAPCPADITGDMVVNVSDLLAALNNWGACAAPCPPTCVADVNGDCVVNVGDLLAVINAWGPCP